MDDVGAPSRAGGVGAELPPGGSDAGTACDDRLAHGDSGMDRWGWSRVADRGSLTGLRHPDQADRDLPDEPGVVRSGDGAGPRLSRAVAPAMEPTARRSERTEYDGLGGVLDPATVSVTITLVHVTARVHAEIPWKACSAPLVSPSALEWCSTEIPQATMTREGTRRVPCHRTSRGVTIVLIRAIFPAP